MVARINTPLASTRKDHSILLVVCIPVLDGGKEMRDETLKTTAWEARFAHTVNCFYGPYPFVYIGQPTSKGSNPLLLLSGILIYVWRLIVFCLGLKTTKFNFLALMLSLLALSQSQTFFSSVLTTFSRDFKSLSGYNRFVSSANRWKPSLLLQR